MHKTHILLSVGNQDEKEELLPFIKVASENKNISFYTTEHTHSFLEENKIKSTFVHKLSEPEKRPNISELISKKSFDYVIIIPPKDVTEESTDYTDDEVIRNTTAEYGIIPITDVEVAKIILGNLGSN